MDKLEMMAALMMKLKLRSRDSMEWVVEVTQLRSRKVKEQKAKLRSPLLRLVERKKLSLNIMMKLNNKRSKRNQNSSLP